jgi:hypothetical protein
VNDLHENDSTFFQWIIGGIFTFFSGWNLYTERRVEKLKDLAHERCVDKESCKEDRERFDKAVDEIKKIIEKGFQGVHSRIDKIR